jgi:hypothetical protein
MSRETSVLVNVGDLVVSLHDGQVYPEVVTGLSSVGSHFFTQTAHVLENTNGENGLCLGLPGSHNDPIIEVLGSIPLQDIAKSLARHDCLADLGVKKIQGSLEAAVLPEPVERPCE